MKRIKTNLTDISLANTQDSPLAILRLGAIAFVNTIPIYTALAPSISYELFYAPPATLNHMIRHGSLDVSPVSSAYYLQHQDELVLLKDLSVSSPGAVESVLFLSKDPIENHSEFLSKQKIIPVPDDSETSVNLLAWLLQEKTGHDLRNRFKVMPASDYQKSLTDYGAALIIGDNALQVHESPSIFQNYHCYDLSSEWVTKTKLPFVFAVWVARKGWAKEHPEQLMWINQLLVQSRQHFFDDPDTFEKGIMNANDRCGLPEKLLKHYFTNALTYTLQQEHYQALRQFGEIVSALHHHPAAVGVR